MQVKIDSNELKRYEKKLADLHRSAFPNAIRSTLNDAAFLMKKNELHTSAAKNFKNTRSKTFFKKFSGVKKAKGWDINSMVATVGLLDMGVDTAKSAVNNMELHEKGGSINKGFIYLKDSRTSKNFGKLVRKVNYYKKGSKLIRKGSYVKKAFVSLKEQIPFKHNDFIIQTTKITKGSKLRIQTKVLSKKRTNTKITPNHFVSEAAEKTQQQITKIFQKNAEYQINKRLKR